MDKQMAMEQHRAAMTTPGGSAGEEMLRSGSTVQAIQTGYVTAVAVQRPRQKKDVLRRVLEEAELLGDAAYYNWKAKNKDGSSAVIEGPSIELAMAMAREYGNSAVDANLVSEDRTHWTFRGVFIDLETGFTCPRLFRQRKETGGRGKMDADRAEDIVYQIGQSKAIRNAVVRGVPEWLTRRALAAAKKAAAAGVKPAEVVKWWASKHKVTLEQLERRVGAKLADWGVDEVATLSGIATALRDRQTTVENEFVTGEVVQQQQEQQEPQVTVVGTDGQVIHPAPEREREPGEEG